MSGQSLGLAAAGTARAQDGNGSIVGWRLQVFGVDLEADFVAVAGHGHHSLGLRADGSIVTWGDNAEGGCDVPAPNTDFVAIAAGALHSLGLKSDSSIVAWGWNYEGQCEVPTPNADFVATAAGRLPQFGPQGRRLDPGLGIE